MNKEKQTAELWPEGFSEGGDSRTQAKEWLIYLYSGEATGPGKKAFSAWLRQSKENASAYASAEKLWRGLSEPGGAGFFEPVADIASTAQISPPSRSGRQNRGIIAAIAIAAMALFVAGMSWLQREPAVITEQYASELAEVKTVILADGSRVTLDAASELRATFSGEERHVFLKRGRAHFDIQPDSDRQFVVEAGGTFIQVLGTKFDVHTRTNNIEVAVLEGLVGVTSNNQTAEIASVRLRPGQQVLAQHDGSLGNVTAIDINDMLAWQEGRLVFVDERLIDIIADINRYRTDKIYLKDDTLAERRISMVLLSSETDRLLTGLDAMADVEVRHRGDRVIVRPEKSIK